MGGARLLGPQAGQALRGGSRAAAGSLSGAPHQEPPRPSGVPLTSHGVSGPPSPLHRRETKKPMMVRQRSSSAAITRPSSAMSPGRYPTVEGDWAATAAEAKSSRFTTEKATNG